MNNNTNNNNSNNDMYLEDNSFNNQGTGVNEPSFQSDTQQVFKSAGNSALGFGKTVAKGVKPGLDKNNNLGLGIPRKNNNPNNSNINNKKKNDLGNKNPAQGQKNDPNTNKNPAGGQKNDNFGNKIYDNKKPSTNNSLGPKKNPLTGSTNPVASKFGLGKKDKNSDDDNGGVIAPNLNEIAQKGIKAAWTVAPVQVKVAVLAFSIVPILIIAMILFLAVFGGTTAAVTASMCGVDSTGSSYNGSDYSGSADVKEFMCKMQDPLANKSLYTITGAYGTDRGDHIHAGLDLASYGHKNIPIYAAQAGTVTASGYHSSMGNYVKISHGGVIETVYMHMVTGSLKVKTGDKVGKGQQIGKMGTTGRSTGVHLHFEIRTLPNREHHNPTPYFKDTESFKKNCGSLWDGELAGDSVNAANDTSSDYISTGSGSSDAECCETTSSGSSESYCPNGITIEGEGTVDFEEYIERVATAENGGADDEAVKAQAIAARTYALNLTDNCKKSIKNSQANQVAANKASDRVKEIIADVSGSVMLYNGKYFSAEYSSFYGTCSGNTCTGTAIKKPTSEKVTFTMPRSYLTTAVDAGHGRGMSQNGANYFSKEGKTYEEILKFFYADDIEITGATNSCATTFDGEIIYYNQLDYANEKFCKTDTIANSGCGATAMAIVTSSLLGKKVTPVDMRDLCCSLNLCDGSGTSWGFFAKAGEKYGLKVRQVSRENADEVLTTLNSKQGLVIAHMGPGKFTQGGHYITLTGVKDGDQVFVHDPNNGEKRGTNKYWDFDFIVGQTKKGNDSPFWIVSR